MPAPTPSPSSSPSAPSHTPGPWVASFGDLVRVSAAGPDGWGRTVVICGVHRIGKHLGAERHAEVEANARLIAAAPDLHAPLAGLIRLIDENPTAELGEILKAWSVAGDGEAAARAALAKATGAA